VSGDGQLVDLEERPATLVMRARATYSRVVADPMANAHAAAELVRAARAEQDRLALALALRAHAWALRAALRHEEARKALDEAVRLVRRLGAPELSAVLGSRAAVQQELGHSAAALRDLNEAVGASPAPDDELRLQLASLHQNAGRLSTAAAVYRLVLAQADARAEAVAKAANNLAIILVQQGAHDEVTGLLERAALAAERVGPAIAALVASTRSWAAVQRGDLIAGVASFEDAERRCRAVGWPLGELYAEYADALLDLRLLPEALDRARRAVAILDPQHVDLMAAEAQLRVAVLSLMSGDLDEAEAAAATAAERFRRQQRATWAARADLIGCEARLAAGRPRPDDLRRARAGARTLERHGMSGYAVDGHLVAGRVAAALGRTSAARESWRRSAELARGSSVLVRLKGRLAAALLAADEGRPDVVRRHSAAGLDDLARHREALPSTELRALASGHGEELGRLGLAARIGSTSPARVLEWMERTRAAALSQTDVHESQEVGGHLGELRAAQAELAAARRETGVEPPELRARLTTVEQRIRRATWTARQTATQRGRALSTADLRTALDGRVLVEYDVLDGELVAALLDTRRTRLVRLGPARQVREHLDALLFTLRYLARGGGPAAPAMSSAGRAAEAALRSALVDPLHLTPDQPVVVAPVAALHGVPWTSLLGGPVSVSPSASMWARSATAPAPPNDRVVLAAGPDLPGAQLEVEALQAVVGLAAVLTPPDSTVASVVAAIDTASLAHLACHCLIRADNPTFSSLRLSDGELTVHELDQRADVPHRVVLAACESGNDVAFAGNEVLGFVATLMAKGSAGVVASSVIVPDGDLLPLMTGLHHGIGKGRTLAEALQDARGELDPTDPATFVPRAAFTAYGAA
jgi:tetratricopeptide (TPR) repeat protein